MVLCIVPLVACEVLGLGGSCEGGAAGLKPEHEEVLTCAGWIDYVRDNIQEIDYVDVTRLPDDEGEGEVTGRAFCSRCQARVATLVRTGIRTQARHPAEVASILVHEATHLKEGCASGEESAERAEADFLRDYFDDCFGR